MDFTIKNNKMLFWRLGNMNSVKQKHFGKDGHQPPTSRGIWCFPFPFHDYFFAYHQWEQKLPKKFRREIGQVWDKCLVEGLTDEEAEKFWEERELALKKVKKLFRPTTFWYGKPFYSHISANNDVSYSNWFLWDSVSAWAKVARKNIYLTQIYQGTVYRMEYAKDHMEIFIPDYS